MATRPRVAVVGSGISGLTAAYLLRRTHEVLLFEAQDRLGGHTHTHDIADPGGRALRVDTGFIVHNDRTYPLLRRLFGELGVAARPTEMSMSIRCEGCGLEYAGGRGLTGVLAQRRRALDPRFGRLLTSVRRFHHAALKHLDEAGEQDLMTYGQFLDRHGFSLRFVTHYAVPLVACVWSSGTDTALEYPARYLFQFLRHHGMLSIGDSPQWRTVVGGSRTYVDRIRALLPQVDTGCAVRDITRHVDGVQVRDAADRVHQVDKVVIAAHADQALAMLADPSNAESSTLKVFAYTPNETVLHTDDSVLPRARAARSSWNYHMTSCRPRSGAPVVTYWMNRLQGLDATRQYLVTLNGADRIDPSQVIRTMHYEHPVYTPESVAAQANLPALTTGRTAYAGAYHGWGFHEDGARSGVAAATALGATW